MSRSTRTCPIRKATITSTIFTNNIHHGNTNSLKDSAMLKDPLCMSSKNSNFELSCQGDYKKHNSKKSLVYSKSNQRSSSIDLKISESF
mmetsp:Transcript_25233/g.29099  ORF Transcript_25233/g.29099 Transcript_25233/m.29099 type:complete len:89 (+) Transcript_25233:341-607(+)